jgi:Redoxin
MKIRVEYKNLHYPYLYDGETQAVTRAYGPQATPHVFVFDKERKLRYEGRVDNSSRTEMVTTRDARNAIRRVAGQPRCDSDAHRGVRLLDQVAGNICIAHRSTTNRSARGARCCTMRIWRPPSWIGSWNVGDSSTSKDPLGERGIS